MVNQTKFTKLKLITDRFGLIIVETDWSTNYQSSNHAFSYVIFNFNFDKIESQPQEESYVEVIPKTHSKVWDHFKLTNGKAKCIHCE